MSRAFWCCACSNGMVDIIGCDQLWCAMVCPERPHAARAREIPPRICRPERTWLARISVRVPPVPFPSPAAAVRHQRSGRLQGPPEEASLESLFSPTRVKSAASTASTRAVPSASRRLQLETFVTATPASNATPAQPRRKANLCRRNSVMALGATLIVGERRGAQQTI